MTELFENFEINREPRWPILARLAAASLVLHAALVASAIYVPGVRSALNIAYLFSDARYVDEDYNRTAVGERAQMIDLAHEKFQYPEGYFATGAVMPDPLAPQIIEQTQPMPVFIPPKPSPTPTPQPSPTPEASPTPQPSPTASPSAQGTTAAAAGAATPSQSPKPSEEDLNKVAAQYNVARPDENKINKRPLKDWLARANESKVKGELDLSGTIEVVIEADRDPQGKLLNANVVQKTGDPRLIEVTKDLVSAVSDSHVLVFLVDPNRPNDVQRLRLTIRMDEAEVTALVESEAESPERAKEMADGYNGLLALGQLTKANKDEGILYKSTRVTYNGKQVSVSFKLPRADAANMLSKQVSAG